MIPEAIKYFVGIIGDSSEIAAINTGVNINSRQNVVVTNDGRSRGRLDRGQIREQLGRGVRTPTDLRIHQRLHGVHLVLRGHDGERIAHTVFWIKEKSGTRLET